MVQICLLYGGTHQLRVTRRPTAIRQVQCILEAYTRVVTMSQGCVQQGPGRLLKAMQEERPPGTRRAQVLYDRLNRAQELSRHTSGRKHWPLDRVHCGAAPGECTRVADATRFRLS